MNILALSGSLRQGSSNTALLEAAQLLAPADLEIIIWNKQDQLPQFSPDLESIVPPSVQALRDLVSRADGLLIACPEYARGIPGAFKNALDWLVGGETFLNKKFTLWNASPRATEAQRQLHLVLETMSGCFVEKAALALPLINMQMTAYDISVHERWASEIKYSLERFAKVSEK